MQIEITDEERALLKSLLSVQLYVEKGKLNKLTGNTSRTEFLKELSEKIAILETLQNKIS